MRAFTFVALAALMAAVAFCQVQENARQVRLRYRLARARLQEERSRQRCDDARAEELRLLRPPRLLALNGQLPRPLAPMRPWTGGR